MKNQHRYIYFTYSLLRENQVLCGLSFDASINSFHVVNLNGLTIVAEKSGQLEDLIGIVSEVHVDRSGFQV